MPNPLDLLRPVAPLTVYRASAGSGKTFRLAVEFIKLLVSNPTEFRHTLAVTFTNKATQEMKARILTHLYGIWKRLDASESYFQIVRQETGLGEELIRQNAGRALRLILHSYSYFKVLTIDAFFQQVMRNLARELDLNANLRVNINDQQVEAKAIDEMIESLTPDSNVLNWITAYIEQNISEDKAWNVIDQIKEFGKNIFRDFYKKNANGLNKASEGDTFVNYRGKLYAIRQQALDDLQKMGNDALKLIQDHGLSEADFSNGKTGALSYFLKLATLNKDIFSDEILKKRIIDAMQDPSKWITAKNRGRGLESERIAPQLSALIEEDEKKRHKYVKDYKSAEATLKNLYQLRLLKNIADWVRAINRETGRFQLSDTQGVLHQVIEDQDAPFIYEKIGATLQHIMIDEFQDTGLMQWQNFKVLLDDCISHHPGSLLVGDVKQSIYRWRDADWQLLNRIGSQFRPSQCRIDTESLATNRRSRRNIVEFNNHFFQEAVKLAYDGRDNNPEGQQELESAYADVCQKVNERKGEAQGRIEIELLPPDNYQETTLEHLADIVTHLLEAGVKPSGIGILTRQNDKIQLIADYFQTHYPDIPLVSNEAFKLGASLAVNIIISAFRVLVDESDTLAKASLAKAWLTQIQHKADADLLLMRHRDELDEVLPMGFSALERYRLRTQPVGEAAETLFNVFSLNELTGQTAYLCAFFDQLHDFIGNTPATFSDVLKEWDENMSQASIESDDSNGIRMLTIHKSKGLEFDTVLMPFCDWKLEKDNTTLWCVPGEAPYNELPIVPVSFSEKSLRGSIYEQQYQQEHLLNMVDNLNLLYVAFTRPRRNLFVIGARKCKGSPRGAIRSYLIENCLPATAQQLEGSQLVCGDNPDTGTECFGFGELSVAPEKKDESRNPNVFELPVKAHDVKLGSFDSHVKFLQSNRSRDFINDGDDTDRSRYIQNGLILHELFSRIRTLDDVDKVLQSLESEGIIYGNGVCAEDLQSELRRQFNDPTVRDWFSGRWKLFNERTILFEEQPGDSEVEQPRPDRVMTDGHRVIVVDFKFGKPMKNHLVQVNRYMKLLSDMGYEQVSGFIWYVFHPRHIVEV